VSSSEPTFRLQVKLTPKAASNRVIGTSLDEKGCRIVKIAVTAVPEDGKANKALVALLAKFLKLPKSAIEIVAGATERRKTLAIQGDIARLAARFKEEGFEL
jgi:uncharacterized protein (TIGR00251 family)